MTLKPMYNTISNAESFILEISRKHGMITTSSLSGQLLRRWSTGNASCNVVFQPVHENCLQALNVVDDVVVLTPGTESKKIVHSKAKLYRGKATDDPAPSTMTMQQSKVNKVEGSVSGVEGNPVI